MAWSGFFSMGARSAPRGWDMLNEDLATGSAMGQGAFGLVAERDKQKTSDEVRMAGMAKGPAERATPAASEEKGGEKGSRRKRAQRPPESHVARALRTAYEETIRENVPDEFLDLLSKLS